ncbi:hypothetical protein GOV04_05075 [Candidatus Woesearchaeota archaeon]|nr:hypothetical protein [Candidatus Woesearchaeota archaeon]
MTNNYKSKGERAIAEILKKHSIDFEYEYPLLIKEQKDGDGEKLRIWYPDFWLPKYSIVIEYFGVQGDDNYDKGKKAKLNAYKKLDIDCISVKPSTINKNLQAYLLMTISRMINDKVRHFENRKNHEKP